MECRQTATHFPEGNPLVILLPTHLEISAHNVARYMYTTEKSNVLLVMQPVTDVIVRATMNHTASPKQCQQLL